MQCEPFSRPVNANRLGRAGGHFDTEVDMTEPTNPASNVPGKPEGTPPQQRVPAVRSDPVIAPPPEVLQRHNARVLDPATAMQLAGQPPVRTAVYVADRLILSAAADDNSRAALVEAARRWGLQLVDTRPTLRSLEVAARAQLPDRLPYRVRLVLLPDNNTPTPAT